ncbi:MAG: hypothetical protein JW983_00390, partial [Elusimicrobia bacterium]|nr:hypothetical protein [Elusimicrobiota bacterium]
MVKFKSYPPAGGINFIKGRAGKATRAAGLFLGSLTRLLAYSLALLFLVSAPCYSVDVITNGSLDTDNTGWSHTDTLETNTVSSDATDYTVESPAHNSPNSMKITSVLGKGVAAGWYDYQSVGTISSADTVKLGLWWRKLSGVSAANDKADIYVTIKKPDESTTDIWSDTSLPAGAGTPIYGNVSNLDVSSYFDQNGTYEIRLRADVTTGNGTGAYIEINWDDVVLDVGDEVAPSAITTLSALEYGFGIGEIDLSWIAPGDNDMEGTLSAGSEFKIEYSSWTDVVWSTNTDTGDGYYITITTESINPGDTCFRTVTGFVQSATYYFRIWTKDEADNWSGISDSATVWLYVDLTAPSAITNISAFTQGTEYSNISLTWSAPGNNDDTGILDSGCSYYIQYSKDEFETWNYSSAQVVISTSGVNPGDFQSYVLEYMKPNKDYYIRIWTIDAAGNLSELSNGTTRYKVLKRDADGDPEDWPDPSPSMVVNSATTNDWVWKDTEGDERTDAPDPDDQYDIKRVQITADTDYIYFLVEMSTISNVNVPHIAISLDTDQNSSDTDLTWFGDNTDLTYDDEYNDLAETRYPEYNIIFHSTQTDIPAIEISALTDTDWYEPTGFHSIGISTNTHVIEATIARTDLGISGDSRIRISVASFRNSVGLANSVDTTAEYAGNDALDVMTIVRLSTGSEAGQYYNDPQNSMSVFDKELSDNDLDFWADIPLAADGSIGNTPPGIATSPEPVSGVSTEDKTPSLSWTAATDSDSGDRVTSYKIELATHSDLNGNVTYRVNVSSNSGWTVPQSLSKMTTYYWRVLARDTLGVLTSTNSAEVWTFYILSDGSYDFDVAASSANEKFNNGSAQRPPTSGPEITGEVGFVSTTEIEASDDIYYYSTGTVANQYASQRFRFTIEEDTDTITGIYVEWEGWGNHENGDGNYSADLCIWDFNSLTWITIGNHTNGSDTVISSTIVSGISNYIDVDGYLHLLAYGPIAPGGAPPNWGDIRTDFIKVEISTAVPDGTAPDAISDLTALTGDNNGEILLQWTSPGDD